MTDLLQPNRFAHNPFVIGGQTAAKPRRAHKLCWANPATAHQLLGASHD